jgi:iron complex outermembrane receptor protein
MAKKSILLASCGLATLGLMAFASPSAAAETAAADQPVSTNARPGPADVAEVVVTGVRGTPRTLTSSPVEVDIISAAQLATTGKSGLKQILSTVVPSLNMPGEMSGLSAASPPYTVEGLTGDYVLVLVNGKRRHNTAIINNLATIGGGSTPVDLDMIPPESIDHVEYLRDGAAAQYGSDAIAGVINIILKKNDSGGTSETLTGQTYKSTGELVQEDANWGTKFFDGFINFSLSATLHKPSPANENAPGLFYPLVNGAPDPREATISKSLFQAYGLTQNTNQLDLSYNLSTPIGHGLEVYSFSTVSHRNISDKPTSRSRSV